MKKAQLLQELGLTEHKKLVPELRKEAQLLGIRGYTTLRRAQLIEKIEEYTMGKIPKKKKASKRSPKTQSLPVVQSVAPASPKYTLPPVYATPSVYKTPKRYATPSEYKTPSRYSTPLSRSPSVYRTASPGRKSSASPGRKSSASPGRKSSASPGRKSSASPRRKSSASPRRKEPELKPTAEIYRIESFGRHLTQLGPIKNEADKNIIRNILERQGFFDLQKDFIVDDTFRLSKVKPSQFGEVIHLLARYYVVHPSRRVRNLS
jgi:hypothetical protein